MDILETIYGSVKKIVLLLIFIFSLSFAFSQSIIKGIVLEASTNEPLPGAAIMIKGTDKGVTSDINGRFEIQVDPGTYTLATSFISFITQEITGVTIKEGETYILNITMEESIQALEEVVVTAVKRENSEIAVLNTIRTSASVASGISSQQISKNQDKDASEVIKRVSGISIIEDKFVIARGLSQRYNNVWLNNSAVPSSESDTRTFSFDMIPGSQIENIIIVKSPQPELPADFTGGFIKITTKNVPNKNSIEFSYGTAVNTQTHFKDFKYNKGSKTDVLGFDNGKRGLSDFVPDRLDNYDSEQVTSLTKSGFNNDWKIHTRKPFLDQKFNFLLNQKFQNANDQIWGLVAALNYAYSSKTYTNMENSRFGIYNSTQDKPDYLYKYTDDQYNSEAKVGGILNLTFIPSTKHKLEIRNTVNQIGKNRYTEREGYQYISGFYTQKKAEYLYHSRLTYTGQLAGTHNFSPNKELNWTGGFSYANKKQPDRRIINWEENSFSEDLYYKQMQIDQNSITRDFVKLNENIYSLTANYNHTFSFNNNFNPQLKTGIYGEIKDRDFKNRDFYYRWYSSAFESDFAYRDVIEEILIDENYGADKLYVYEDTDNRNSYSGKNHLYAAYIGFNIPVNALNIYAGVRFEHSKMSLVSYTHIKEDNTKKTNYYYNDLFPSINLTYNINKDNLLRFAYGMSTNRQEFRELSSSVYYDFDLFSSVRGNPSLKPAYVQNFDIKYEFYPSNGEMLSFSLFYKRFNDPIEWTYLDSGGNYTYTFENANSANNYGLEIDVKKNFDFIGLPQFSFIFNGSLIKSKVKFGADSREHDRPMQGQSPYLINTGLFYNSEKCQLNTGLLYNIIGKRIVGIGKVDSSEGSSINNDIPDMYEMPRNVLDFVIGKKFGKCFELTASCKDILAQKVKFKQFPKFEDSEGKIHEREQTTKEFRPGRNISLTAKFTF